MARVGEHFAPLLGENSHVPFLTSKSLPSFLSGQSATGTLTRWRCMVTDTGIGNELLVPSCEHEGKRMHLMYGAEDRGQGWSDAALTERVVIGATSVPGEQKWVGRLLQGNTALEDAVSAMEVSPSAPTLSVYLKVYDARLADELRPAELVDVVGLVDLCYPASAWPEENDAQREPQPCIHVLALHRTSVTALTRVTAPRAAAFSSAKARYEALVTYIAGVLAGDTLAAEYITLSLLARIQWRVPGAAVGALTVNLTRADSVAEKLSAALEQLCPVVAVQSLALPELNNGNAPLYPQGTDYGLHPGRLQLVDGTVLVVDEISMGEGQLGDTGVRNVRTLSQLISRHTLVYLYPFSEFEVNTDINVLVLSTGRSFLPADVHIPWQPSGGAIPEISQDVLDAFRTAILDARVATLSVSDAASERIQAYFVERRKADAKFTQDDLQRYIGIARLIALGTGGPELGEVEWARAVELENMRAARIST